jgi:hypothetical protein
VTTPRTEQFRVVMPDGLIIERLPVGYAHGHWRISFVCSGVDFGQGDPPRATRFTDEFRARVSIEAVSGDLDYRGGGTSGGGDEQEVHLRFADNGIEVIEITYHPDGATVAREVIELR